MGYLKAFPRNETVDSYISKTSCGTHGKANITEGSCLHRNRHWQFIHCSDPRGNLDTWYAEGHVSNVLSTNTAT